MREKRIFENLRRAFFVSSKKSEGIFTKEVSLSLKGLSAVEIMMGHLGISTGFWFLYPSRKAGVLFVGIFFMISGYGLMRNFIKDANYLNYFLIKRIGAVLLPAYVVYLLSGCLVCLNADWDFWHILCYIFLKDFWFKTNWYVFEILFFYLLFWAAYKFFTIEIANVGISIIILIFIYLCYYYHIDNPWYGSSLCFPLGIFYAQKEQKWNAFLSHKYWFKNFLLFIGCAANILLFFVLGNDSIMGNPVARNMACVCFELWILSVLQKVKIDYSVFRQLGKISYEIFLVHPVWIDIIRNYTTDPWKHVFWVMLLTAVSSFLLQILIEKIKGTLAISLNSGNCCTKPD